jgi:hypothetical protein
LVIFDELCACSLECPAHGFQTFGAHPPTQFETGDGSARDSRLLREVTQGPSQSGSRHSTLDNLHVTVLLQIDDGHNTGITRPNVVGGVSAEMTFNDRIEPPTPNGSFRPIADIRESQRGPCSMTLIIDPNTLVLDGATGVELNGSFYDVEFVDGTCVVLFSGCDSTSDFGFQSDVDAVAAAQVLINQVLLGTCAARFWCGRLRPTPEEKDSSHDGLTLSATRRERRRYLGRTHYSCQLSTQRRH